jgi:hypothetical protein
MSFPWLQTTPSHGHGAHRRTEVALAELAGRAGLYYRLGYSEATATERLIARIAWEYDHRPSALSDTAIGKLVSETYARRPG